MTGFLPGNRAPLSDRDARMLTPLSLAQVGDAIHSLYVRTELVLGGVKAGATHRGAIRQVNAKAQAEALARVRDMLTEQEADVVRRGRNAHARHDAPRRADPNDYAQATGLEALLGFLYLTGRMDRINELYAAMRPGGTDS